MRLEAITSRSSRPAGAQEKGRLVALGLMDEARAASFAIDMADEAPIDVPDHLLALDVQADGLNLFRVRLRGRGFCRLRGHRGALGEVDRPALGEELITMHRNQMATEVVGQMSSPKWDDAVREQHAQRPARGQLGKAECQSFFADGVPLFSSNSPEKEPLGAPRDKNAPQKGGVLGKAHPGNKVLTGDRRFMLSGHLKNPYDASIIFTSNFRGTA